MDDNLYEEYLDQLVVEVEGKIGTMPPCLRNPLQNEQAQPDHWIGPISSPFTSPRMSTVDEGSYKETKASPHHQPKEEEEESEKDVDTSEEIKEEKRDDSKDESLRQDVKIGWKDRLSAFERNLQCLRDSMDELRHQDIGLARQLLLVNDSIEELKWLNENYELYDSKPDSLNTRSLSRYDSREQLHERWLSERRLLTTSRNSLNASLSNLNLSNSLSRLNQNNNSNGPAWKEDFDEIPHVVGPDTSPIIGGAEFDPYHPRSMSTSCAEKSEYQPKVKQLLLTRPASTTGLVRTDTGPSTSTPKTESNKQEESNLSSVPSVDMVDSREISRVRLGSYGSQVRWYYKQTSEEEMYF